MDDPFVVAAGKKVPTVIGTVFLGCHADHFDKWIGLIPK